jgi:YidC/Oxa1 family membrane protein insertase
VDRRFLLFVVLSFLVLMANAAWNAQQAAKRRAQQQAAGGGAAAQAERQDVADDGEQAAEAPADDAEAAEAEAPDEAEGEEADADAEPATAAEFVTLGSVDASSPYRMGVTLTNVGAGVRRIELSNPRYLDLHICTTAVDISGISNSRN